MYICGDDIKYLICPVTELPKFRSLYLLNWCV